MEEIDYKAVAEQLQRDLEMARARLTWMNKPSHLKVWTDTLQCSWNKLSYIEKVYTIAMMIFIFCAVAGLVRDLYRE